MPKNSTDNILKTYNVNVLRTLIQTLDETVGCELNFETVKKNIALNIWTLQQKPTSKN